MSLATATLIPGLLLAALGGLLASGSTRVVAALRAFPRSRSAAWILFSAGAAWFLFEIARLSEADFGEYRRILFVGFLAVAVLSFRFAPDFLAVRGACVLVLMGALPLLEAAYMQYHLPQRLLMVSTVYAAVALAVYLGASPFRLRDFFDWLFAARGRARAVGTGLLAAGLAVTATAFTY